MKKTALLAVMATAMLVSTAADAREFEITPFVGYQFGGDVDVTYQGTRESVSVNHAVNYGLALNLGLTDMMQLELLYNTQGTSADARRFEDSLDLTIDYLMLSALWDFEPYDDDFSPFLVFGLGASRMRPDGFSSVTRFSGNIGGGLKYFFSDRVGVRIEGRLYGTYINTTTTWCDPLWCYGTPNNLWQFSASAGLIFRLGDY
jgi:opacity protein-like surface antigen